MSRAGQAARTYLVWRMGEAVSLSTSRSGKRPNRPTWQRSLFRVWDALHRTARCNLKALIELRIAEQFRATQPRVARQHLRLAARAVRRAEAQRKLALDLIVATGTRSAYKPRDTFIVQHVVTNVFEWRMEVGAEVDELWQRLNEALALLPGALDDRDDDRPGVWTRGRLPRRFLTHALLAAADRIHALFKRRQRSKAAAPEDAPRRVSRGRAPPFLSAATL